MNKHREGLSAADEMIAEKVKDGKTETLYRSGVGEYYLIKEDVMYLKLWRYPTPEEVREWLNEA